MRDENTQIKNNGKVLVQKLQDDIHQVREENTKIKNNGKAKQQLEIADLYREFEEFKKDIRNQVSEFSKQCPPCPSTDVEGKNKTKQRKKKKRKKKDQVKEPNDKQHKGNESNSEGSCTQDSATDEEESADESVVDIPLVPGPYLSYSDAVEKKERERRTLIISTSITRSIKEDRFNMCYGNGNAEFQRFRGFKVKNIKEDMEANLDHGVFDSALLHIGGNDLPDLYRPQLIFKLANEIIDAGLICRKQGADTVFIAGVTVRRHEYTWERCRLLNQELKELCKKNNFVFIDNTNINVDHLCDGVHLNEDGDSMLANNYLGHFRKAFSRGRR